MEYPEPEQTAQALSFVPEGCLMHITHGEGGDTLTREDFSGRGLLESYPLFPGITLTYVKYLAEQALCRHHPDGGILELSYCRRGRSGWNMRDGSTIYLGSGDCSIHRRSLCADSVMTFPNGFYEGLSICIDLALFSAQMPPLLQEAGVTGEMLCQRFCREGGFTVLPGSEKTGPIFGGFYDVPPPLLAAYQRLKLQELLLYLSLVQPEGAPGRYQPEQIQIVKEVHGLLVRDLSQRITIEALSRQFLMNPSTLKTTFKAVYGNSIAAHIREHRMEAAARLLRESDESVSAISRAVGYESQSKFSTEFRKAFHMLPSEYRRLHRKP